MEKTKRQLRAEAVERLREMSAVDDYGDWVETIAEIVQGKNRCNIGDVGMWESLIELLSDDEPQEGDALEKMREFIDDQFVHGKESWTLGMSIVDEIADMVERDYVQRMDYEDAVELCNKYVDSIDELTAERDELRRKLEILKAHGVEIVDAVAGGFEVYNEAIRERDEWKASFVSAVSQADEYKALWQKARTERDEWKAKAESCNPCGWWDSNLQYCKRDSGAKRSNMEWLYEHEPNVLRDAILCIGHDITCRNCDVYMYNAKRGCDCDGCSVEWLLSEHVDEPCSETYMDAGTDTQNPSSHEADSGNHVSFDGRKVTCPLNGTPNGTCPDANGTASVNDEKQPESDVSTDDDGANDDKPTFDVPLYGWRESCGQYPDQGERESAHDCESDSREKLEADVREVAEKNFYWHAIRHGFTERVIEWLDRQEAIIEREWEIEQAYINSGYKERIAELQDQLESAHAKNRALKAHISKMQEGRHGWHVKYGKLAEQLRESNRERERLRKQLGIALDHAHDMIKLVNLDGDAE